MALTLSSKIQKEHEDMAYWIGRVEEARIHFVRAWGEYPKWIILSPSNWRKMQDVWKERMIRDLTLMDDTPMFMGLKMALTIMGNKEADVLEVR